MYKYKRTIKPTTLRVNESYPAERIEQKMQRVLSGAETIKDGAPLIYTDRKDGVRPELNIRTDKWEIAAEAMDKVNRARATQATPNPVTGNKEGQSVTIDNAQKGGEGTAQSAEGTTAEQPKK